MPHTFLADPEFGDITIAVSSRSRNLRLAINARGDIRMSIPPRTPQSLLLRFLDDSRAYIRQNLAKMNYQPTVLRNSDRVGKTHTLYITRGEAFHSRLSGVELHITVPLGLDIASKEVQTFIQASCLKALRTQAKAYLPRRLKQFAQDYGFVYETVRFSNAGTRWGSCSSRGTISLNIWLMQLPFELIDYVLIHELCHTRNMNHSPAFWASVEAIVPDYKARRKALKEHHTFM